MINVSRRFLAFVLLSAALIGLLLACGAAVSKTSHAPARPVPQAERARVLFLLTSAGTQELQNGKRRKTGYFLPEFYEPFTALKKLGHEIHFASPEGKPPRIDPEGMEDTYWQDPSMRQEALDFVENDREFTRPLSLDEALRRATEWDGLVIPGGQGVMIDLFPDDRARELLSALGEKGKAVGLICHAPALLARLGGNDAWSGRRVTAVSPFEEFYIETFVMGGKARTRKIGRSLRQAGFDYDSALPKANHAVRDCNLVTSQNPFSGEAFIENFLPALRDAKLGLPCGTPE